MRWWFSLLITAVMGLTFPFSAFAQGNVELDKARVSIWPEYDQPGVLIIYRVSLSSKMTLPAEVSFRIPQAVKKPNAVAMQDVDGSLVTLNYSSKQEGDWTKITFTTPSPDIQIEYYDSRLTKSGSTRNFEYRWPGDYTVNALTVEVQQPVNASNMQITPNLGPGQQQSDGLTYFETNIGALKSGTPFTIKLSYAKSDDALSHSTEPVNPAGAIDQNTPGRLTFQEILPWLIGALGILLIAGGGLWYWQSGREQNSVSAGAKRRHVSSRRELSSEGDSGVSAGAVYCNQCGRRANSGDIFCRTCGTKLRS
jgi:hypothetical protein